MTPVGLLDTGVLLSYAEQSSPVVGHELIKCEEAGEALIVSMICLAEAYERASEDGVHLLDALVNLRPVHVERADPNDARVTGLVARRVGRLGLAHTCMLALGANVPVVTDDPEAASRVLRAELIKRMN